MVQDLTTDLTQLLNGLVVTHNGSAFPLGAGRNGEIEFKSPFPLVSISVVDVQVAAGVSNATGHGAELFDGYYSLSIRAINTDSIIAENFLKDASNAINAKLRTVASGLGPAWNVRLVGGGKDMPPRNESGALVYERVLTLRAQSAETF